MDIRMSNIASPMPQIRARFTSKLGIPLSGCKVYTYEPNSNIPKTTWVDIDKTVENTNPILLDAAGEADIFLDGLYRVVVKDRFGFVVYDVEKTGTHTEWDTSFVVYGGLNQKAVNDGLDYTSDLLTIQNPTNGMSVKVKSYSSGLFLKGGGNFTFVKGDSATPNNVNIFAGNGGNWHRLNWKQPSIYDAGITGDGLDNTAKFQALVDAATSAGLSVNLKKKTIRIKELDIPSNMHIYNGTLDTTSTTWGSTYGRGAYMFKNTPRSALDGLGSYLDYAAAANYVNIVETKNIRFVNVHFKAIPTAGVFYKFEGFYLIKCSAEWTFRTLFWMIGGLDGTPLINDTPSSYNLIDPINGRNKDIRIKDCNFNAGYNRMDATIPFHFNACEDVVIEGGKNNSCLGWHIDTYNKNIRINQADVVVTDPNVVLDRINNTSKPEMLAVYVGQNSYDIEINGGLWKDYGDMGLYVEGGSQVRLNGVRSRHSNPNNVAINVLLQPNWRTNTGGFRYLANVSDVYLTDCDFVGAKEGVATQAFNMNQQSLKNIHISGGRIQAAGNLNAVVITGTTDYSISNLSAKGNLILGINNGNGFIKSSRFENVSNYALYIGSMGGGIFPEISNTDFIVGTGAVIYNNGGAGKSGKVVGGSMYAKDFSSPMIQNGPDSANINVFDFEYNGDSHIIYPYTLTAPAGGKSSFYYIDARFKSGWSCVANIINSDAVGDLDIRANVLPGSIYVTIENKSGAAIKALPINIVLKLGTFASCAYPN